MGASMIKRTILALAMAGLISPALASGTIPFSLSQQLDQYAKPLAGCKFYTIQAGTTSTPQNAYQDAALTLPLPNPQICDTAGRLPQMFIADGLVKVRLTDKNGVTQVVADGIQVIGPSGGGGGGGGSVDPTTILATGDVKSRYGTGVLTGFVRLNGRTIGSSTSGATERANADTQSLFEYLWQSDANLVVSTGRGASSNADWVANKTIALPDGRGRILASLDDMGNSPAGVLTAPYFTPAGTTLTTTLGAKGGFDNQTLLTAQIPSHFHTAGISDPGHAHLIFETQQANVAVTGPATVVAAVGSSGTIQKATGGAGTGVRVTSGNGLDTTNSSGGGGAHTIVPPVILVTNYIKL